MFPNISNATEVFSCKTVSEAHLAGTKAYGSALYGDSDFDRSLLSQQPTKVLIIEHKKQVTFGGDVYKDDSKAHLVSFMKTLLGIDRGI